jgi:parallel beta-helix repeat protein
MPRSFRKASSFCSFYSFCSIAIAIALFGCGEDERANAVGGASGTGGDAGRGGSGAPANCDITLSPGQNDTEELQTALIEADPESTICLQPGTYELEKELLLTGTAGVTVRGIGVSRDEVVLDFSAQDGGDEAVDVVKADRFTLESVTLKDPPGDGVKVSNSDRPTFRNVKAYWAAGSAPTNGAYALYPALSNNVLIEHCEVVGAADAGIYLGQSTNGVVRHNKAYGNVIGIEAENSTGVAIYDNEAWDNTCGILVVSLPGLTKKEMRGASVFDNLVYDNNRENFGEGGFVASVPRGTGILIATADETHVYANTLRGNGGPAILALSWPTIAFLTGLAANDDQYDQFSEGSYIHDNTFSGNGGDPPGAFTGAPLSLVPPIEAILWDGFVDPLKNDPAGTEQRRLCIINNPGASFRNFNVPDLANPKMDLAVHACAHAPLPRVVLE